MVSPAAPFAPLQVRTQMPTPTLKPPALPPLGCSLRHGPMP